MLTLWPVIVSLVSTVTKGGVTAGGVGDALAGQFPCWRIWRSRPRGMWWATRRGNVQYHDAPRRPGWGITVGGVATLAELADLLAAQRELEGPELPAEDLLTPWSRGERGRHEGGRGGLGVADRPYVVARGGQRRSALVEHR